MAKKRIEPLDVQLNNAGMQWFSAMPYPQAVVVYRLEDYKKVKKLFKFLEKPKVNPRGCCTEYIHDNYCVIMVGLRGDANINTIAHECIHARSFIYDSLGVKVDFNNDEHEAYFMGMLVEGVVMCAREIGLNV